MTLFELGTRINHFFTAKHFRGHGIHSPFLYDFVRTVVLKDRKKEFVMRVENRYWPNRTQFVNSVDRIDFFAYAVILSHPFSSRYQYKKWLVWRKKHRCLSVHLPGHIVIFFDRRLQDQHFKIRS